MVIFSKNERQSGRRNGGVHGRYVTAVESTRKASDAAQTSMRHFILSDVMPPGKSTLNALQRERTQTTNP